MEESLLPPAQSRRDGSSQTEKIANHQNDENGMITIPQDFEIEEVEVKIKEEEIENGGTIEIWQQKEVVERARIRPLLAYWVISLWSIWTLSGLVHFLLTGNTFLIVTSPPFS